MAEKSSLNVLGKVATYIILPIGVLVVIYKFLETWFMGPVNAIIELWKQQYDDYVMELKQFSEEDEGNLTAEHQQILEGKIKMIEQTEQTFAQVSGRWDYWIGIITAGAFAIIGAYVLPSIVKKWKDIVKKGDVQGNYGQGYLAMCMMADDLAARGMTAAASALSTVIATRFNNIDAPYMQSQITYWQNMLPQLTGWQLLYAYYIIQAYQVTLVNVPTWMTYLPSPVVLRR